MLVKKEVVKTFKKEPSVKRKYNMVEKTVGESITDQSGKIEKSDIVKNLSLGLMVQNLRKHYGLNIPANDLAETFENTKELAEYNFDNVILPELQKKALEAKNQELEAKTDKVVSDVEEVSS